jgi:hypothetical protein
MVINNTHYTSPTTIPSDIDSRTDVRSTFCCLEKGYTPPPFRLVNDYEAGVIKVVFEKTEFTSTCNCQIECVAEAEGSTDPIGSVGKFCPEDEDFEVVLTNQSFSTDSPTVVAFTFEDANGNISTVTVSSVLGIIPKTPMGLISRSDDDRRTHTVVAVPLYSQAFVSLRDTVTQYQIERYIRNTSNSHIWVDWTNVGINKAHILTALDRTHWDRDILQGVDYGYRVRFRSAADDASQWSEWLILRA